MSFERSFEAFASFGGSPSKDMDNSHFSKMLKECKIIGKSFTSTDADLLFNKIKAKGARKLTYDEFKTKGITEIATKMKKQPADIEAMITSSSPEAHGTKADNVKFHDDKTLYTGVYKAGGPTNVDRNAGSLSGVVDRRNETIDNRGTVSQQK
uniref:Tubulin polymerization-promoting protein family member 2 n=1 Tax=Lygus hesperus TaxID=30085 RepID=A0A0A9W6G5_LYGHE